MTSQTNLIGYWKLDETSGTVASDSFNDYNGALTNAVFTSSGKINCGVDADAAAKYFNVSGIPNYGAKFTITFWLYRTGGTGIYPRILSHTSNGVEWAYHTSGTTGLALYSEPTLRVEEKW